MELFSVHDIKANLYFPPQAYRNTGEATRAFDTTCRNEETNFAKYPDDFTLCKIGNWNEEEGLIEPCSPQPIARATDYVNKTE